MSEGHMRASVNALKVPELDPMYGALTPERLLRRLCSHDVPSDISAFKERYVEVSKEDTELFFSPEEPELKENLFGPLRQAKMNYLLGNYIGSIALCGIVAEKVAILVHAINTPCEAENRKFVEKYYQAKRIKHLKQRKLVCNQSVRDFEDISAARKSPLHHWSTPDDDTAQAARQTYAAATRLVVNMMDVKVVNGKISLNPRLRKYLEDKGEIVAAED